MINVQTVEVDWIIRRSRNNERELGIEPNRVFAMAWIIFYSTLPFLRSGSLRLSCDGASSHPSLCHGRRADIGSDPDRRYKTNTSIDRESATALPQNLRGKRSPAA